VGHAPRSFCFSYFLNRLLHFLLWLAWIAIFVFMPPCTTSHPPYWLRRAVTQFLPNLALNFDPHNLLLPSGWNCRCEPPHPPLHLIFKLYIHLIFNLYLVTDCLSVCKWSVCCHLKNNPSYIPTFLSHCQLLQIVYLHSLSLMPVTPTICWKLASDPFLWYRPQLASFLDFNN
jgi:hypothetical protein